MSLLITVLAFALAIGVLVTVHEFGHYWVARRCGVKVLTFSIGFGRPLLTWQRGETQWQLAAIPLGGYVRMLDEREAPVPAADLDRAFNRQAVSKRIAIVAAGPLANFLLAILIYWAIFLGGVEVLLPRIGTVAPGSLAAKAGFVSGDTVVRVGTDTVDSWAEARLGLIEHAAAAELTTVTVQRPSGEQLQRQIDFRGINKDWVDGDLAGRVGLSVAVYLDRVGAVQPEGVAAKAGLKAGDRVVQVNGQPVADWNRFAELIRTRPGQLLSLTLLRGGQRLEVQLRPQTVEEGGKRFGRIGVAPAMDIDAMQALQKPMHYGPLAALAHAAGQTWQTSALSVKMMWRMLTGHVSLKQLSGPVTMADYAGQSAQYGLRAYLEFLCLISISLGIMNLLPVPVLDGGHLMYYFAEILRGRPLSERVMELGQRVGVGLLAAMMVVAVFNDLSRLVGG